VSTEEKHDSGANGDMPAGHILSVENPFGADPSLDFEMSGQAQNKSGGEAMSSKGRSSKSAKRSLGDEIAEVEAAILQDLNSPPLKRARLEGEDVSEESEDIRRPGSVNGVQQEDEEEEEFSRHADAKTQANTETISRANEERRKGGSVGNGKGGGDPYETTRPSSKKSVADYREFKGSKGKGEKGSGKDKGSSGKSCIGCLRRTECTHYIKNGFCDFRHTQEEYDILDSIRKGKGKAAGHRTS